MPQGFDVVRVEGLADFRKELRAVEPKLGRNLGQANKRAAEMVATKARSKALSLGGVAAHAAPSIKAAADQMKSKITIGGPKNPEGLGAEFGGQGRPTTMQFKPHKGREGYALYPTIRATQDEFMRIYQQELDDVFRQAFPN